jgi:hypothetical protein
LHREQPAAVNRLILDWLRRTEARSAANHSS